MHKGQDNNKTTTTINNNISKRKENKPDAAILTSNNSVFPCGVDVHVIQSSLPHYVMSACERCSLLISSVQIITNINTFLFIYHNS